MKLRKLRNLGRDVMGCEHCDCYHYRSEFIRSFIEHEVCCDCKVSDEKLNGEAVPLRELQWQPIETAPKDGTVVDVWLGGENAEESDIAFYCDKGTRRSTGWAWRQGKWRPLGGLSGVILPTFVVPTHWMPLPAAPCENKGVSNASRSTTRSKV